MKKIIFILGLVMGVSVVSLIFYSSQENWEKIELLENRLNISMPPNSTIEARQVSIMAAPNSAQVETRVVYELGHKKLALMATELFSLAGERYESNIRERLKILSQEEKNTFKVSQAGPQVIVGKATEPNLENDAILYTVAYVKNVDHTIQRIDIYFNHEFNKTPERCRELSDKIINSIQLGSKKIFSEKKTQKINERFNLFVELPDNYVTISQVGPDFSVHYIREVTLLNSPFKSIGIYIGGHPGYHHEEIDEELLIKKPLESELFGEKYDWIRYSKKGDVLSNIEIILRPPKVQYYSFHIFSVRLFEEDLEEILNITKTLKVQN